MEYKDYYKILGVDKNADEKEIKKTYRKLARQYHPDYNPGDPQAEARFKEINEAYEVLSDPDKRQKYNRLGANWQDWQQAGRDPSGFDWGRWTGGTQVHVDNIDPNDLFGDGPFSDFFQSIFGGGATFDRGGSFRQSSRRGRDVDQPVKITLKEAFNGTQRILALDGRRLEIKIPAGVRTGSRVRVAGEGYPGQGGGSSGDLYLLIEVEPHPIFERKGNDLRCQVTVDLYTAVLGGEVSVPTMGSRASLRIPEGTQPGQTFRLRGQGMPTLRDPNQRGNLLARVQVHIPQDLNEEETQLFQRLAKLAQPA